VAFPDGMRARDKTDLCGPPSDAAAHGLSRYPAGTKKHPDVARNESGPRPQARLPSSSPRAGPSGPVAAIRPLASVGSKAATSARLPRRPQCRSGSRLARWPLRPTPARKRAPAFVAAGAAERPPRYGRTISTEKRHRRRRPHRAPTRRRCAGRPLRTPGLILLLNRRQTRSGRHGPKQPWDHRRTQAKRP
jgi:hypothetical protein